MFAILFSGILSAQNFDFECDTDAVSVTGVSLYVNDVDAPWLFQINSGGGTTYEVLDLTGDTDLDFSTGRILINQNFNKEGFRIITSDSSAEVRIRIYNMGNAITGEWSDWSASSTLFNFEAPEGTENYIGQKFEVQARLGGVESYVEPYWVYYSY